MVRSNGMLRRGRRRDSLAALSSRSWKNIGILPPSPQEGTGTPY
jgi:hypothetical protein